MILKAWLKILHADQLFLQDQLGLVQKIVKASLLNFPFQNVTTIGAFLPRERRTPDFKNFISAPIQGVGGLCGHLNNYIKLQLESLGYPVDLAGGEFIRTGIPMSHFVVRVKIPGYAVKDNTNGIGHQKEDRNYIVDVGCGIPLHEPICLEKLPYRGRAGGLNYRYERADDNTIRRVHENGDALMGERPSSYVSPNNYDIDIRPRHFTEFREPVQKYYTNYGAFPHQNFYCFRYLDFTDDDFQCVCIRGKELLFVTKETRHSQTFSSFEDVKPSILKYFPMIDPHHVELAVKHFSMPLDDALKMSSKI